MKNLLFLLLAMGVAASYSLADDYISEPAFFNVHPEKVKGERVPDGAVGYQIIKHNGKVHWLYTNASTIPVMWFDAKAAPKENYVQTLQIPKKAIGYSMYLNGRPGAYSIQVKWIEESFFKEALPSFPSDKAVGQFAYLQLADEAIGPQALDAPELTSPFVSEELQARVNKSSLAAVKAIFDAGEKPGNDSVLPHGVVAGKCVYRAHPTAEVGGALIFSAAGREQKAGVWVAAWPEEIEEKVSVAKPDKFTDLDTGGLTDLLGEFRAEAAVWSPVVAEVPDKRGLPKDSLFFEVNRVSPSFQRGYRLRTLTSLTKKTIYAVEGYSTHQGNTHAGRRLRFLEPVVYCFFYKTWSPSK